MAHTLESIATDVRTDRILGNQDKACAVYLWLLQLQQGSITDSRLLYGYVVPSTYRNDSWNAPREDAFKAISDGISAQILRVSLFTGSKNVKALLNSLLQGSTIGEASAAAVLQLPSRHASRFGSVALATKFAVRPPMHLPSRDYYHWSTNRLSPMSIVSADSSALTNLEKSRLFFLEGQVDRDLAMIAVNTLRCESGMDFDGLDSWRLGDLELLTFPALDDEERPRFEVKGDGSSIRVTLNSSMNERRCDMRVRARLLNDGACFHTHLTDIPADATFPIQIDCNLPQAVQGIVDAYELDIDATNPETGQSRTCLQWGVYLLRGLNLQLHVAGNTARVQSDWLAIALPRRHEKRLQAAQAISKQTTSVSSHIGDRGNDPWVAANRQNVDLVSRMLPKASLGRLFLRYSEEEHTGRLELAEWLKALFANHRAAQIAWFDPYMEDIGVALINQYGFPDSNYLVFTGYPKEAPLSDWPARLLHDWGMGPEVEPPEPSRIDNLVGACRHWMSVGHGVKLRVIGLPPDELHDRMILIRDAQLEPVAGYHLSNSVQRANENFPLLITPIPHDVLHRTFDYVDATLRRVFTNTQNNKGGSFSPLIFDSAEYVSSLPIDAHKDVWQMPRASEVFAWWLDDSTLSGLDENALRTELETHGHLIEGHLRSSTFEIVPNKLWSRGLELDDFGSAWEALGTILASSIAGDNLSFVSPVTNPSLSTLLATLLDSSRPGVAIAGQRRDDADMVELLQRTLSDFMRGGYGPEHLMTYRLRSLVGWGDYYAIKVLWTLDPTALVNWIEASTAEVWRSNLRRQRGLSCAIDIIGLETSFGYRDDQLDALLSSSNDLIRWIAFAGLESHIQADPSRITKLREIPGLGASAKIQVLGWLILRRSRDKSPTRDALIDELSDALPQSVSADDLVALLNALRNPSKRIYDSPPWLFQDIISPLISAGRLALDLVARTWVKELIDIWKEPERDEGKSSLLFNLAREGSFTDEVAALIALSSETTQKHIYSRLQDEARLRCRSIEQPMSAQVNWTARDRAFDIKLWIGGLACSILRNLPEDSQTVEQVQGLLNEADRLMSRRATRETQGIVAEELSRYRGALQQSC